MDFNIRNIAGLAEAFLAEYSREPILRSEMAGSNGHGEKHPGLSEESIRKVQVLFLDDVTGNDFLDRLDTLIMDQQDLVPVAEYLMDMAVLRLIVQFDEEGDIEAYFESDVWLEIEDRLESRGSELLNVLVYLKDCLENKAKPSLKDFLNEFLLVEEDDFQEEFEIYEPFIRNSGLLEGQDEDLIEVGNKLSDSEVADMFVPLMLFFKYEGKISAETINRIEKLSDYPGLDCALLKAMQYFYVTSHES